AVLWNPDNPGNPPQLRSAEIAGRALGVRLQSLQARTPDDLEPAFVAMARQRVDGVIVLADVMLNGQRARIADLALARRLPAVYGQEGHPPVGLSTYRANTRDLFPALRQLRGPHPERREAGRPARRAGHQVRAGDQPQDRQGP